MRFLLISGTALCLSACQMQLPIATEAPVEATPDAATATAEDATELAALSEAFGAAATPVKPRKGLFAFLKPDPAPSPFAGADIAVLDDETVAAADGEAVATEGGEGADEALAETAALMAETAVPAKAGLGGFFSFLKPKAPSAPETLHQAAAAPEDFETRPETLGVVPDADARPDAAESAPATPRKGLFVGCWPHFQRRAVMRAARHPRLPSTKPCRLVRSESTAKCAPRVWQKRLIPIPATGRRSGRFMTPTPALPSRTPS